MDFTIDTHLDNLKHITFSPNAQVTIQMGQLSFKYLSNVLDSLGKVLPCHAAAPKGIKIVSLTTLPTYFGCNENWVLKAVRDTLSSLRKLKERLKLLNHKGVMVSGSGPSVFALSETQKEARKIQSLMSKRFSQVLSH